MDLFEYAAQSKAKPDEKKSEKTSSQAKKPKVQSSELADDKVYSVGELTSQIKTLLKASFGSGRLWIKGEISNYRGRNQSGHMYFRLKDNSALISCVFFRGLNAKLKFDLEEGMEVVLGAKLDLWDKGGSYQLVVEEVRPAGQGEMFLRFEQLKKKLESKNYFSTEHKKPLPSSVKRLGVVTSETGSVFRDIIHVVKGRCPSTEIWLLPVKVQGAGSEKEIAEAILYANREAQTLGLDALIVGRGGGSIEDLWSFNEECVAEAIFQSTIPIVSAVGHQTDFTIADFVADVRAATPSHAAELVVPNIQELKAQVDNKMLQMVREISHVKQGCAEKLNFLLRSPALKDPFRILGNRAQTLDMLNEEVKRLILEKVKSQKSNLQALQQNLLAKIPHILPIKKAAFETHVEKLKLLNPLEILSRGYSAVYKEDKTSILKSTKDMKESDDIWIRFHEGAAKCKVKKIQKTF